MNNEIRVSIIIPTKNRAQSLQRGLKSLEAQDFSDYELIVVDGGSVDETEAVVKEFGTRHPVQWMTQSAGGLVNAMNQARERARGRYLIRTDDDVVFAPGWLKAVVETFEADPAIGGVTGPTVIPPEYGETRDLFYYLARMREGRWWWRPVRWFYNDYLLEGDPYRVSHWCRSGTFTVGTNFAKSLEAPLQEVDNLEACNWAVRRELLEKVGGFDPIFSGVGEYHEPDAALKIRALGCRLMFNPRAVVNHCPSTDGFFKDRPDSAPRLLNFITFYCRHIKPNTVDKFCRFMAYLFFQNMYYMAIGVMRRQWNQFGCLSGTFNGLWRAFRGRIWSGSKS
ncbi:MAG: glycosyltransferase [Kiritimatiellia bacterium]